MTERPDHRTRLLADTVHGDWTEGPGADFARQAAANVRRRLRLRRGLQTVGAVACLLIAALVLQPQRSSSLLPKAKLPEQKNPAYEIISDEELLAQLRDRPLLAIRKQNGTREFILLDH